MLYWGWLFSRIYDFGNAHTSIFQLTQCNRNMYALHVDKQAFVHTIYKYYWTAVCYGMWSLTMLN